ETPMGKRLMRRWLGRPLRDRSMIEARLDAIEILSSFMKEREELRMELRDFGDLERLLGRFASARQLPPRDYLGLKFMLWKIPRISQLLEHLKQEIDRSSLL